MNNWRVSIPRCCFKEKGAGHFNSVFFLLFKNVVTPNNNYTITTATRVDLNCLYYTRAVYDKKSILYPTHIYIPTDPYSAHLKPGLESLLEFAYFSG